MPNVRIAISQAAVDTFSTVSAVTGSVTATANAASHYASTLEAHARNYREITEAKLAETAGYARLAGVQEAKERVADRLIAINDRLEKDKKFAKIFNSLNDSDFLAKPVALHAAE